MAAKMPYTEQLSLVVSGLFQLYHAGLMPTAALQAMRRYLWYGALE